jgi:hypothetical protein
MPAATRVWKVDECVDVDTNERSTRASARAAKLFRKMTLKLYDRSQFVNIIAQMASKSERGAESSKLDRDLYDAAERGEIETVRKFLLMGASPNFVLPFWNHPILHRAVFTKHYAVMEALLAAGAEIEAKSSDRSTALHLACDQNDPAAVQILLRHGANDDALTIRDLSPLVS